MITRDQLAAHLLANDYGQEGIFFSNDTGINFVLYDDHFELTVETLLIPGSNQWFSVIRNYNYDTCDIEDGNLTFWDPTTTEVVDL